MRYLRRIALSVALFSTLSAWANAESTDARGEFEQDHHGQGYLFFGPGGMLTPWGRTGNAHFGGGGEALLYKGIGVGFEGGYFTPWRNFGAGLGLASVNGSYHFGNGRRLSPFVTGGYSLAFREGHANLVNVGGGINWWAKERIGLRLEFRDHIYRESHSRNTEYIHFVSGRIGFAFR